MSYSGAGMGSYYMASSRGAPVSGLGAYWTPPGRRVFSGLGDPAKKGGSGHVVGMDAPMQPGTPYGMGPGTPYGMASGPYGYGRPLRGFGGSLESGFNGAAVWADWKAAHAGKGDNAAGLRAADQIRAALASLGYDLSGRMGLPWNCTDSSCATLTTQDSILLKQFGTDHNFSNWSGGAGPGYPNEAVLNLLQMAVKAGTPTGPDEPQEMKEIPGGGGKTYTSTGKKTGGKSGVSKAGLTTGETLLIAVAGLAVVGGLVYFAKKRHPTGASAPASGTRPLGSSMAANFHR